MARKKIKDELLDHDYDGIQELDNDLPPWWLYLFYFSIIFAVVYMLHYHVLGTGDLQAEEYAKEVQAAEQMYKAPAAVAGQGGEQAAAELEAFTDQDNLDAGKQIFLTNCQPCHGQFGEGGVGPNLTDDYWLHGNTISNVVNTITVGVPAKGMVPWGPILKPLQIRQVASYILTLHGTNPPNPKAPQGEKMEY